MSPAIEINEQTPFRFSQTYTLLENNNREASKDTCEKDGKSENQYEKYFLKHNDTAENVETDVIGKQILNQLPASFEQLIDFFKDKSSYVSPKLLRYYVLLFKTAGILEQEPFSPDATETLPQFSEAPSISVIIVTFNGEKFIHQNLASLYRQSLPASEIILVDNDSTDGSMDHVAQNYNKVKIIRNKRNYHYAKAVNIGIQAATNDLVIILNQDIQLADDFIQQLFLRYRSESDKDHIAGVVPQMQFSQLKPFINGIGNFITAKNWGSDNYFGALDIGQFEKLAYVGSACFGAILVTKQSWQTIGPLDKTYKSFYEDADWSMRAHLKGFNLLAAPKAIVYHAFGGSYPSGIKLTFIAKNRLRFVFKHLKGKIRSTFFKKYLKQDIKNGISSLRSHSYINIYWYIKAYIKLFFEIPNILLYKMGADKSSVETIEAFFTKGTPYVAIANKDLSPVINKHVIRSYYYFTEIEDFDYPVDPIVY
jgi:GT2 family glycosyltransferase